MFRVPIGAVAHVNGASALACRGTDGLNNLLSLYLQRKNEERLTLLAKYHTDAFCVDVTHGDLLVTDSIRGVVCITSPDVTPLAANEQYRISECLWIPVGILNFRWV